MQHPFEGVLMPEVTEARPTRRSLLGRLLGAVAGLLGTSTAVLAQGRRPSTRAIGEEGGRPPGGWATTYAVGEEGGRPPGWATTYAVGEEGGRPPGWATTYAIGEEGGPIMTSQAIGEEGGYGTTYAIGEEGGITTYAVGEEGGRK